MHAYRHFGRYSVFQRRPDSLVKAFGQVAHSDWQPIRPASPHTYRLRGHIHSARRTLVTSGHQAGVGVWRETSGCSTRMTLGNSPNGLCKGDPLF